MTTQENYSIKTTGKTDYKLYWDHGLAEYQIVCLHIDCKWTALVSGIDNVATSIKAHQTNMHKDSPAEDVVHPCKMEIEFVTEERSEKGYLVPCSTPYYEVKCTTCDFEQRVIVLGNSPAQEAMKCANLIITEHKKRRTMKIEPCDLPTEEELLSEDRQV
jgi:hypothetical protein